MKIPSRRAMTAATATLVATGAMVALAANSAPRDNAGKAFAARPVVETSVRTTTRTVHVKRRLKVALPAPGASDAVSTTAGRQATFAADTSQSGKPVDRSSSIDQDEGEDSEREWDDRADEDEGEFEREEPEDDEDERERD